MLELGKIARDIDDFGREKASSMMGIGDELSIAGDTLKRIASDFDGATAKIDAAETSWLVANFDEPPDAVYDLPECPSAHAVVAVDGSQIAPGKHEIAFCFLINTAAITLYYGTGDRPEAESLPVLYYKEEDLFEDYARRKVPVTDKLLSIRRSVAESTHLEKALQAVASKGIAAVALWDGSLIRWSLENEPTEYKRRMLDAYLQAFNTARGSGIPIAGYISDPGSKDLINALRVTLCPDDRVDCENCRREPPLPCDSVARLTDGIAFGRWLKDGQRSVLLTSSSKILKEYGDHVVRAFYVRVGRETVRVEVPQWVASDRSLLDLVHAVCCDQAAKGRGYPVALSEAHERAVIHGPERAAFYDMVERAFVKYGARVSRSQKRLSKGF